MISPIANNNKLERGAQMATPRRKYRLADSNHADIDLRDYKKVIKETVNRVVPGKEPRVYKEYFSTDLLSHSEAVTLGRALAKIETLYTLGKTVTTFRLFDGQLYDSEAAVKPSNVKKKVKPKGGRMT